MTTAIYARISLDRQDGAGVDRQLEDCRALVKRGGWDAAVEYVDKSVSAFKGKLRPRYQELLAAVKTGEVSRIVVWHLDRLYRHPRELEDIVDLADAGRVEVITVRSGDLNLGTTSGITMARIAVAFANQESRDKSGRIKRQKQQARDRGQGSGGPTPLGWKATWTLDPATGKKRRLLSEDPHEVAIIRAAITDLLKGASLRDIAERWNAIGVKQPQARSRHGWNASGIRQIVSNPRLAGQIGHRIEKPAGDGVGQRYLPPVVVGKALLPGIIHRAQWEQLQAVLAERGANGHMPRRRSLLTGLVTCALCGSTMVRSGARGHGDGEVRKVWRCMTPGGGHPSIDAVSLENLLVEATLRVADTTSFAAMVRQRGRQGKQARDLVAELGELERQIDEASTSFAAGRLPIRAFEHATAAIHRQQKALQGRLGPLTDTASLEPYAGRRGALRAAWPNLSVDQQREIIGTALGPVTVSPTRVPGRRAFDTRRVKIRGTAQ